MPKGRRSLQEREELAATRLLRVLATYGVANMRTLEQKISDGGPFNQRIDPHVLTPVRNKLVEDGALGSLKRANAPWFFASNTQQAVLDARLNELLPVYRQVSSLGLRAGQVLEIAVYKILRTLPDAEFHGRYPDFETHDDSTNYTKIEPPNHIGERAIPTDQLLDFHLRDPTVGWLGIECKNVRHWLYPHVKEIIDTLRKCLWLDVVPVVIARRIPYVTFHLFSRCGVIFHETYNQFFPYSEAALAVQAKHKSSLGYHDIKVGNEPDARLAKFITTNLFAVAPVARKRYDDYKDLLWDYAFGNISYAVFAAKVRRRWHGLKEENDFPNDEVPEWIVDEE